MQKLSINRWWLFEGIELHVVIDEISSYGFNGLELDLSDPANYNINELKKMFNKYNVRPSGIAAVNTLKEEYDLCSLDEDIRKRAINDVKGCLSFAKEIGAPVVVILPGLKQGGNNDDLLFNNFIENLKVLGEVCEELNLRICIENAHGSICENSDDLMRVFEAIGGLSGHIGALFDTGHFLLSKESLNDVATKLGRYIYHLHIDNNGGKLDDHALPTVGLLTEHDFV
jgi:D-psicose/D-tagatose/L-ribulose 3-epimerase